MKKSIKQTFIGLALSVFSISAMAQCPQLTNLNLTLGANGTASVNPVISGTVNPTQTEYYWTVSPNATQTSGFFQQQGTFQFPANGTYTLCLNITDSLANCWTNQYCTTVNISNMSPTSCQAGFTYNTDSSCVTHFVNTSIGSNLTYEWYINGNTDTTSNPSAYLSYGFNAVRLLTYSSGILCDSIHMPVYVYCGSSSACNASFTSYTDTNCVTHLTNSSTGTNLTYEWYDLSNYSLLSTQQNPSLNLGQGYYIIGLITYSNYQVCYSSSSYFN